MSGISNRSSFLFATFEGGGNVTPILGVARRLAERGHRVCVVSDPCNRAEVEAVGASFAPWSEGRPDKSAGSDPIKDWEISSPLALAARVRDRMMIGPAHRHATDLLRIFRQWPADAVIVSDMMFGAMVAAERSGAASAIICANIPLLPVPGLPPVGPGFMPARGAMGRLRDAAVRAVMRKVMGKRTDAFNSVREAIGLPPLDHPLDQPGRLDAMIVLTSPAFEFPSVQVTDGLSYAGPELADPVWVRPWTTPWADGDRRPLVLVAFSTTFQDQGGVLDRVVAALGVMDVRALVTTGPALAGRTWSAAANVHICESAPHGQLLGEASVVITHAGHGTTIRTLAAGVPQLCMPMGRDQNDNAARVVFHGVGLRLKPTASLEAICCAVSRLIEQPGYRDRAREIGRRVRADAENSSAVSVLEALAERKKQSGKTAAQELELV